MKVNNLKQKDIKPGLRIKSLSKPEHQRGTIISVDPSDDFYTCVYWDGNDRPRAGWYGNDSEAEVVLDSNGKPEYITLPKDLPDVTIAKVNTTHGITMHLRDLRLPTYGWDWVAKFPSRAAYIKKD